MKPTKSKQNKQQKYVLIKHVMATSVEDAIKHQSSAPVLHAYVEQIEQAEAAEVGFKSKQ